MSLRLLLAAAVLAAPTAAGAQAVPALPEAMKLTRMSGVGLVVSDLERSRQFYTDVLGFRVAARVPAQGPVQEYLLGLTGDIRADTLVVIRQGQVPAGATAFGRVILVAPNARGLAERAAAAGYRPSRIVDGTNVIRDPDGYAIELYQRPAAR
ncbi:VOC family protein [Phenylobacterium sp. VNQ135]|uniref:VOC family protein n=1 Tax=Phenylobacterium sp. VNQ135 TaxID=3400922 RepID=UPI003BFC0FC7